MTPININPNTFDNIQFEPNSQPMKTGKTKSWMGEYHWVRLAINENLPDRTEEAISWCKENFEKSGSRWFEKSKTFYFKDEKDMSMFVLKWS